MPAGVRLIAVAFGFMTRLPVPHVEMRDGDLARASMLFPLVGLVVATVGIGARFVLVPVLGPVPAAVAGVLMVTLVTGAFHEDGLADAADGIWGGWEPAERLQIMRDSRLGTYGTVALIAAFALRFALLVPASGAVFAVALICGHVLGRAAGPVLVRLLPALHDSSSAGIAEPRPGGLAVVAILVAVPLGLAAGVAAIATVLAGAAAMLGCALLCRRRLAGVTGDAIGATTVVVEVTAIATVVAWSNVVA